jgi:hypothetical protein
MARTDLFLLCACLMAVPKRPRLSNIDIFISLGVLRRLKVISCLPFDAG